MSLTAFVVRVEPPSADRDRGDRELTAFLERLTEQRSFQIEVGSARIDYSSVYPDENEGAIATGVDPNDASVRRTLVFDGWLENREELIGELAAGGATSETSDSQLVLKSIERWGENAVHRLYGEYSFVCLTSRAGSDEPEVFAVRDKVGIRPLFYSEHERKLALSNFPGALSAIPWVGSEINEGYAAEFLCAEVWSTKETIFRRVARVLGGHWLQRYAGMRPKCGRYWFPDPQIRRTTCTAAVAEMRMVLLSSTLAASRCIGPLGVQISGGIDSSSVACVVSDLVDAGQFDRSAVVGMSQVFPGHSCDETKYIESVERAISFSISKVQPSYAPLAALSDIVARTNYPYFSYTATSSWDHDRAHRRSGGRVVIGGEGGDELLALSRSAWRSALLSACDGARSWRRLNAIRRSLPQTASALASVRVVLEPFLPRRLSLRIQRARDRRTSSSPLVSSLDQDRLSLAQRLDRFDGFGRTLAIEIVTSCNRNWAWELLYAQYFCRGIERRNPLLSARVLEFTGTLSPDFLEAFPSSKRQILTNAAGKRMPTTVVERTNKAEFSGVVRPRLHSLLREYDDVVNSGQLLGLRLGEIRIEELPVWSADALLSCVMFEQRQRARSG